MKPLSASVKALLDLTSSPDALSRIATGLRLDGGRGPRHPDVAPAADPRRDADLAERGWLEREGFAHASAVADPAVCVALVRAIEALRAVELPAVFVYAFDEPWALAAEARKRISALVGHDYRLVDDVWAWHVPPASRGWPPHRGISDVRLAREAPELINVWVALSDVTADRACMYAVSLADDPGYPDALGRVDAPLAAARALPAPAGDALFWNANVLHWGGRCSERASGPRVSCSFSLSRVDAAKHVPDASLVAAFEMDLTARMDLLARMVLVYGGDQADVSDVVREWATITHGLTTRFSAS